jgi:hypothetical protein
VEPPPAGDVTYAEAREVAGERLALIGYMDIEELDNQNTEYIRNRIQEILSLGKQRLILGASAGPISEVMCQLVDKYKLWIDTYLEHYGP